ncbi:AcrR family transcriptional regulator [Paenibacillus anaericanus]|uniref:TetR/AcrR family transcriptional regulator n=1 Tax=Paenibacillus anaericanus TaxID=170367 RepID=UPI0027878608|nr:TetR/AcrR family transcriptional regulator [Paenibacillus anaericanus]MDQ0087964.1 AcrR family transcriptional regulator [Paenibacillus anaericanus]
MRTKEKILVEALRLFSISGFEAVSVRDIAGAVGVHESSLYKHYKNKQDIFDTIIDKSAQRIHAIHQKLAVPNPEHSTLAQEYKEMSLETLGEISSELFLFYLRDDVVGQFRKMLTIEQYRNSTVSNLFKKIFIDDALQFQSAIFKKFMDAGSFVKGDPYIMALHFYSPIFLLLCKYDSTSDNDLEASGFIKKHIAEFSSHYAVNPED